MKDSGGKERICISKSSEGLDCHPEGCRFCNFWVELSKYIEAKNKN